MNRFKEMRKKFGYSQQELANLLFVNQTAISQWERGVTSPNKTSLAKLCELFSVSSDYLLGIDESSEECRGIKIPVLGRVQAGIPFEAVEEILDWEEISPEMAATGDYFALRIRGQSMEPRMCDGDVIIIRKQSDVDNGDIAVILVNGFEATVKKIKKTESGVTLIPSNPAFDPIFYANDEIKELPVQVIGKVVELRAKY